MWKITWFDVTSYPIKEEVYTNFNDAKRNFRLAITKELGDKLERINDYINKFVKNNYKENPPITFEQLKYIFTNFIANPDYPSTVEEAEDFQKFYYEFKDLEDEKIDIFLSDNCGLEIAENDEKAKFLCGYIDLLINGKEPSYSFFLEDNWKQFANNRIFASISLEDEDRRDEIEKRAQEEADTFIDALKNQTKKCN